VTDASRPPLPFGKRAAKAAVTFRKQCTGDRKLSSPASNKLASRQVAQRSGPDPVRRVRARANCAWSRAKRPRISRQAPRRTCDDAQDTSPRCTASRLSRSSWGGWIWKGPLRLAFFLSSVSCPDAAHRAAFAALMRCRAGAAQTVPSFVTVPALRSGHEVCPHASRTGACGPLSNIHHAISFSEGSDDRRRHILLRRGGRRHTAPPSCGRGHALATLVLRVRWRCSSSPRAAAGASGVRLRRAFSEAPPSAALPLVAVVAVFRRSWGLPHSAYLDHPDQPAPHRRQIGRIHRVAFPRAAPGESSCAKSLSASSSRTG